MTSPNSQDVQDPEPTVTHDTPPTSDDPGESQTPAPSDHQSFWLWVMCLTGVDYFSTLGYLPYIAYVATGELAPIATILLVLVTLGGALPIYAYVASRSPHGMGSISLLERVVKGWSGKLLVLTLLGFVATAFLFTKTLSASDAAEHLIENPLVIQGMNYLTGEETKAGLKEAAGGQQHSGHHSIAHDRQRLVFTMILLVVLGGTFLRGFKEVIGLAVAIVGVYLFLNACIILSGIAYLVQHPESLTTWLGALEDPTKWNFEGWPVNQTGFAIGGGQGIPWGVILLVCLLYFPKLALGLSGFETGLMVMPLIRGDKDDDKKNPQGRIRNTRKLLVTAAVIMCFYLLGSAMVVTMLISPEALREGGPAANRALAFVAHGHGADANGIDTNINPWLFGNFFGTLYDLATVVILWFAGASAMAGLLNLIPQYLPRYGMAPEWAKAIRPLILLFTGLNLIITWMFNADVQLQSGAYATGVLVFIFSGCAATLIDRWQTRPEEGGMKQVMWWLSIVNFGLITLIFAYTTISIMFNAPDGILIALCVILIILITSIISRIRRSTELRFIGFEYADSQTRFLWDSLKLLEFPVLVPHRPGTRSLPEKEQAIREEHRLTQEVPIVFLEVELGDVSEFWLTPSMEIIQEEGRFIIRVTRSASIAHVIAAIGLELSKHGSPPEIHFGWSDDNPLAATLGFLLFGEGNVPLMVRNLVRRAEPEAEKQPRVIVG
ncbi:MAG: amino acid transporter [Gemmataceae bacterium]